MRFFSLLAIVSVLCAAGCGGEGIPGDPAGDATAGYNLGSATPVYATPASDTATTVTVHNFVTLTLQAALVWRAGGTGEQLVLSGTTSQDIAFVQGFIPDDKFGDAAQPSKRSFELVFSDPSDIDTVIAGTPFFLELTTHTVTGNHPFAAQFYVSLRLVPPQGSVTTRLVLGPAITPVEVTDNPNGLHFRGTVRTSAIPQWLTVTAGVDPALVAAGPRDWHFDWLYDGFVAAAQAGTAVVAKGKFGASTSTRTGTIAIRLARAGLAAGTSPDDLFGFPACDPAVKACLDALPPGTIDFGACGSAFEVNICRNS